MPESSNRPIDTVIKLIGETAVLPGASLLLDGQIKNGAIHALIGLGARALLAGSIGAPILFLTAANSFSLSVSDKDLWTNITDWSRSTPSPSQPTNPESLIRP